jgi:diguanylate cyclase (GGDEF)-like protein
MRRIGARIRQYFEAPVRRIVALWVLANLLMVGFAGLSLDYIYQAYRERAVETARNTNHLLSQRVASELHRIDFGLKEAVELYGVIGDLSGPNRQTVLSRPLAHQWANLPMLEGLLITDAKGTLTVGDIRSDWGSIGDRDYFVALRDNPGLGLVISKTLISRISGTPALVLARALTGFDGRFEGIVAAALPLDWFNRQLATLDAGRLGMVAISGDFSRNFDLLARAPMTERIGDTLLPDAFLRALRADQRVGTYAGVSQVDQVRRTYEYRKVDDFPLMTMVGIADKDVTADWQRTGIKVAALTVFFMVVTLWGARMTLRAWQARAEANDRAEFLTLHDSLTGLPNRSLVRDRFDHTRALADRNSKRVALIDVDLDDFKTINDTLGYSVGDLLLRTVARRLQNCLRDFCTVSRQGADEFLILLPDLAGTEAVTPILDRLTATLAEPVRVENHALPVSVSMGIAIYPEDGGDFDTLHRKADVAMHRAKQAGRNIHLFFDDEMNVEAQEHFRLCGDLRLALMHGEFVLYYQPQVDLDSGAVVGAEALIRWNHPELGLIFPGSFIPIAEHTRLIVPIGEWVLREACRQGAQWAHEGLAALTIAVNLSAVQFRRGNVEQVVEEALAETGFDPFRLELELTESILIHKTESVLETVGRLKQLGVKLSIDDFGTGYSSLAYLKRFNVDKLKIDRSFVRDLVNRSDDEAIVRAIVQMGQSLNLKTIAEGVEDHPTVNRLRCLQCDEGQGYHFARPMPAKDFANYLRTGSTGHADAPVGSI